jgi:hypothetical protein
MDQLPTALLEVRYYSAPKPRSFLLPSSIPSTKWARENIFTQTHLVEMLHQSLRCRGESLRCNRHTQGYHDGQAETRHDVCPIHPGERERRAPPAEFHLEFSRTERRPQIRRVSSGNSSRSTMPLSTPCVLARCPPFWNVM